MKWPQIVILALLVALIAFVAVGANDYQSQQAQINQLKREVAVDAPGTLNQKVATLGRDWTQISNFEKQEVSQAKSVNRQLSTLSGEYTNVQSLESNDSSTESCLNSEFGSLQQFASQDGGLGSIGQISGFGTCY